MTDEDIDALLDILEDPRSFNARAVAAAAIRFLRSERDDAIATGNAATAAAVSQLHVVARERDEARALLSEGLDLCVRARKLDDLERRRIARSMAGETTSGTVPLWAQEQYERDLAEWETRARAGLAAALASDGSQ